MVGIFTAKIKLLRADILPLLCFTDAMALKAVRAAHMLRSRQGWRQSAKPAAWHEKEIKIVFYVTCGESLIIPNEQLVGKASQGRAVRYTVKLLLLAEQHTSREHSFHLARLLCAAAAVTSSSSESIAFNNFNSFTGPTHVGRESQSQATLNGKIM
jgi:hypothetical protein